MLTPSAQPAPGNASTEPSAALTIALPARNEASSLDRLLPRLRESFPDAQVLVVNDGSTDDTSQVCLRHNVTEIAHPYSIGNGAAIKTAARHAAGETLVLMDADGQHDPADIPRLLDHIEAGYDMVIGARGAESQASAWRGAGNRLYSRLASWMTGHRIDDLTSGFRAARTEKFREFLFLLPNGFSYPTTITMAFFRAGYAVAFVPISVSERQGDGRSHIRLARDGIRFLLIIFRIGTLYSPLKVFFPLSVVFFFTGLGYYMYTYMTVSQFTNMGALLFITSIVVFLIGLVSEQITNLLYSHRA